MYIIVNIVYKGDNL